MKCLYLLRGLPGSGKSTLAKSLNIPFVEADMFFLKVDGGYDFHAPLLPDAHKWCQDTVKTMMESGREKIAVSNTFTQEWEMKPYFEMAKEYGYTVFTLIVENRHGNENIHNVPENVLDKMEKRFDLKLRPK